MFETTKNKRIMEEGDNTTSSDIKASIGRNKGGGLKNTIVGSNTTSMYPAVISFM